MSNNLTLEQHIEQLRYEVDDINSISLESAEQAARLLNFSLAQDRLADMAQRELKRAEFEFYCRYGYFLGGN